MGTTAGQPNPNPTPPQPDHRGSEGGGSGGFDINRVVSTMIVREKGNSKAVIRHLVREGRRYRNKLRIAEADLATRPPVLKEGEVILNMEDAKKWTALKEIKLTPEQVKESLKKKDELEAQANDQKQEELLTRGSKDLGIKRPKILAQQTRDRGMIAEDREVVVEADGKRTKVMQVHVRPKADDKAPWRPLKDFVDTDLKDYQPALMADEEPEDESSGERGQKEETTVMFPAQRGARGRAPAKDAVVKVIGDKYASPSELRKQKST